MDKSTSIQMKLEEVAMERLLGSSEGERSVNRGKKRGYYVEEGQKQSHGYFTTRSDLGNRSMSRKERRGSFMEEPRIPGSFQTDQRRKELGFSAPRQFREPIYQPVQRPQEQGPPLSWGKMEMEVGEGGSIHEEIAEVFWRPPTPAIGPDQDLNQLRLQEMAAQDQRLWLAQSRKQLQAGYQPGPTSPRMLMDAQISGEKRIEEIEKQFLVYSPESSPRESPKLRLLSRMSQKFAMIHWTMLQEGLGQMYQAERVRFSPLAKFQLSSTAQRFLLDSALCENQMGAPGPAPCQRRDF